MTTVGVVGNGVVGNATARAFMEHAEVRVYDAVPERRTHPLTHPGPGRAVLDCDVVFVCLPTPMGADGRCDLSAVDGFFRDVTTRADVSPEAVREAGYVLRSTVPVGTTRRLAREYGLPNLLHCPEFLTARCAATDAQLPARNVVGYPTWECGANPLPDLLRRRFPGVPLHLVTSDESEFVKSAQNSFFAVKVSFWNEARSLADRHGLDWGRVMDAVLADGRIAHSHTRVPGRDGFGFGGSCLPKDLSSFACQLADAGLRNDVTAGALARNADDRRRPA